VTQPATTVVVNGRAEHETHLERIAYFRPGLRSGDSSKSCWSSAANTFNFSGSRSCANSCISSRILLSLCSNAQSIMTEFCRSSFTWGEREGLLRAWHTFVCWSSYVVNPWLELIGREYHYYMNGSRKAGSAMRQNEFDPEFPCDGELVQTQETTDTVTVCFCLKCYTELRYTPGSTWVTVIYPGMRKSTDLMSGAIHHDNTVSFVKRG